MTKLFLCVSVALGAFLTLPSPAEADPVSAVGDGPGPMADVVCRTLDNDPSVASVRYMLVNFTGFMVVRQAAWDTILNGVAWNCPQHADSLRNYAAMYGNY